MDAYVARRGGWGGPNCIATTAEMTTLATELLPGEPMYQPIPFYPNVIDGSGAQLGGGSDVDSWVNTPGRVDLTFYQGDDVMIPLTITDPSDPTFDMSTGVVWTAEIRVLHTYRSTLANTFSITDAYTPPNATTGATGFTAVTMFLARSENIYVGDYRWDLYSLSPLNVAGFPKPPDVISPEPWPPTDRIRTWLYGMVTILPRVTATDILPVVAAVGDTGYAVQMPIFVGPNGRVP